MKKKPEHTADKKNQLRCVKNRNNKTKRKHGNRNAKDVSEKSLFAYDEIFADIVNGTFFNGELVIHPEDLVDADAFSHYKTEGTV